MFTIGLKISLIFCKIPALGYSFSGQYSNYTNKVTKTDFPDQAVLPNPVQYSIAKNSTEKPVYSFFFRTFVLFQLYQKTTTNTRGKIKNFFRQICKKSAE
jgi:hypothetical protein